MAEPKIPHQDPEYKLYVYIIESEAGVMKVGFSGDPQARLLNLLTGHPFDLQVVYTKNHEMAPLLERAAHRILAPLKIRNEWFKCSREEAIEAVEAAFDIIEMMNRSSVKLSKTKPDVGMGRVISLATPKSFGDPSDDKGAGANVRIWLRQELSDGPRWRQELLASAGEHGISGSAVDRAAARIGVTRGGAGGKSGITWSLPTTRKKRVLDKQAISVD
jgi:hypothetical protein